MVRFSLCESICKNSWTSQQKKNSDNAIKVVCKMSLCMFHIERLICKLPIFPEFHYNLNSINILYKQFQFKATSLTNLILINFRHTMINTYNDFVCLRVGTSKQFITVNNVSELWNCFLELGIRHLICKSVLI